MNIKMIKSWQLYYWFLPVILTIFQAIYILASTHQLYFEEVDAITSSFYFSHHLIWRPGQTNVGWQELLTLTNLIFGFDIFNAKFLRLFLYLISIFCLADLLKRLLGEKKAIIPLLTIGLSPTLLFFNTLIVPYGVDLQFFPICLYLILGSKNKVLNLIKITVGSFITMLAWMSYPTFIFYLPILGFFYLKRLKPTVLFLSAIAFLLPVIFVYFYIQNKELLFDYGNQQGLFMANAGGSIEPSVYAFYASLRGLINNLFFKVNGYHYEVNQGEFSLIFPIITLLLILILPIKYMGKFKEIRLISLIILIMAFLNLISNSLSLQGVEAFRRVTPVVASFYGFFIISLFLIYEKGVRMFKAAWFLNVVLALFLLHHLIVYPINLNSIKEDSPYRQRIWFQQENHPQESVNKLMEVLVEKDLYLNCNEEYNNNDTYCPYTHVLAILSSECSSKKVACQTIYGYFPIERAYRQLDLDLLLDYDQQRIY